MRLVSVVAGLMALTAVACASGDDVTSRDPRTASFDTLANGVVHVRNEEPGAWSDDERWRIVEDLRIGSDVDGDPALFSQVVAIGASPAGDIVVADGAAQELRIFDDTGAHVRTLGGKGGGPGEFQNISGLAWDDDGVLWVADIGNARYARFDRAYAHAGDVPMRAPGALIPWLGRLADDGFLYDAAMRITDDRVEIRHYRIDRATGEVLDTLPPIVDAPEGGFAASRVFFRLAPRMIFRMAPDGTLWFGDSGAYRIAVRAPAGDTIRIAELARPRVPVTAAERDSVVRALAEQPPPPGTTVDLRAMPTEKPAFERIHFDDAGHVLVEPVTRPEDAGRAFDVFDADGRFLGQARGDVAFETFPALPFFAGEFVYGVTSDETGAQAVVRARIRKDRS